MTDQTFAPPITPTAVTDERAGFWIRFGAAVIDAVLLGVVGGILQAVLHGAGSGIGLLLNIGYFTYCEGGTGQTIGKRAVGIRVVDINGGGSIGYTRGFLRWIGRILSTIVVLLGYFWMLWDPQKQTWHDKIANSVVVPFRG